VAEPLHTIRQKLSRLMGETIVETPTSGGYTTTGFRCSALAPFSNDYFNDRFGRFYEGIHKDTNFVISDFVSTNGVVTFSPAVVNATNSSDKFEIFPDDYAPQEMIDMINLAITSVRSEALLDHVDSSIQTVASTFEYNLPDAFVYVESVILESGTADRYSPSRDLVDGRHWQILPGTPPKLWFDDEYVALTASRALRLIGQAYQPQLVVDADICHVDEEFIIYQAQANLHLARADELDDAHYKKMVVAQARADGIRRRVQVAGRGVKVNG
jgi:hypothetical protein